MALTMSFSAFPPSPSSPQPWRSSLPRPTLVANVPLQVPPPAQTPSALTRFLPISLPPSFSRFVAVGCFCLSLSCPSPLLAVADVIRLDENVNQSFNFFTVEDGIPRDVGIPRNALSVADLYRLSAVNVKNSGAFLDLARVFTVAKSDALLNDIQKLEMETGWKLRVLTKSGSSPSISGMELKDLWKPDEKTIIVIEDLSAPNILNFNTGIAVSKKLPRQFFVELQSRYGNQFYVGQEGESAALAATAQAIDECLRKAEGCKNVPGLTSDLYNLTLATSVAGGCVFGFAARLPPSGRVQASWQWLVYLSPLWLLLVVSFGVLPVISRTSELEPLLKNALGFSVAAAALYLTPIFGPSPISKQ